MNVKTPTSTIEHCMDDLALKRRMWIQKNQYYYSDLYHFFRYHIPPGSRVLEIGCGTGELLHAVKPSKGVGVDISGGMLSEAKKKYKHLSFLKRDAHDLRVHSHFDYVIISDTIGYFYDIQRVFMELQSVLRSDSRVIITYQNPLWTPFLELSQTLGFKMPSPTKLNWLTLPDIENLLHVCGFETIKKGRRFLLPIQLPGVSSFANRFLAHLPILNSLCLTTYLIARLRTPSPSRPPSASIIIPARNESGNIAHAIQRIPQFTPKIEVIFIEGHSKDDTYKEIQRVCKTYKGPLKLKYARQTGEGKGDAVRKGFALATNELLFILDADLTVPPEDLPKFYQPLANGTCEFANGSRLVYPMEEEAMRFLNYLGNTFFSDMFSWLLGQRFKDTLCGTKALSKKSWNKIVNNRSYFGEFDPFGDFDLIFGASKLDLRILEIPIRYRAREYGTTNISRIKHGILLFKMVIFALNKLKFI